MKNLLWKIKFCIELKKILEIPYWMCWESALAMHESLDDDIDIYTPKEAAEDEAEAWLSSC